MSQYLAAIKSLQDIFDKYAGKEGDKKTLTKGELSDLLHKELGLKGDENKSDVDDFFKTLDGDKNGVVDFPEFMCFTGAIALLLK